MYKLHPLKQFAFVLGIAFVLLIVFSLNAGIREINESQWFILLGVIVGGVSSLIYAAISGKLAD